MAIYPLDPSFNCTYAPPGPYPVASVPATDPPPLVSKILSTLPQVPTLPPGVSPQQLGFPYLKYSMWEDYDWDNNTILLPIAKTPTSLPVLQGDIADSLNSNILNTYPTTLPKTLSAPSYGGGGTPVSGSGSSTPSSSLTLRPSAKAIQVAAPSGRKIVTFEIVRLGAQPQLPDPTPKNANEVLKSSKFRIFAPIPTPSGDSFYWVAAGVITYLLVQPYWASDGFVGGSTPADNTNLTTNWYPPSNYSPGVG